MKQKLPSQAELKSRIEAGRQLMAEKHQLVQNLEWARDLAEKNKVALSLYNLREIAERR